MGDEREFAERERLYALDQERLLREKEQECETLHKMVRGSEIDPTTIVLHGRTEREWKEIGNAMILHGLASARELERRLDTSRTAFTSIHDAYTQAAIDRDQARADLALEHEVSAGRQQLIDTMLKEKRPTPEPDALDRCIDSCIGDGTWKAAMIQIRDELRALRGRK
jgi:choline dehydrogenase-like flavoprotein